SGLVPHSLPQNGSRRVDLHGGQCARFPAPGHGQDPQRPSAALNHNYGGTVTQEPAFAAANRAVGLHRVIEPAGVLPQAADKLDTTPRIGPDEVRIRVERVNLYTPPFWHFSPHQQGEWHTGPVRV